MRAGGEEGRATPGEFSREVLARYLGIAPDEIRLLNGPNGKPHLAPGTGLEFNHSGTGGVALLAVSRVAVGLDIERADRAVDELPIARRYFHPDEAALLGGLAGADLRARFLAYWCAKEAVLKWTGEGLSGGLGRARIGLRESLPETAEIDGRKLALAAFRPTPDHLAVLATEPGYPVKCWFRL